DVKRLGVFNDEVSPAAKANGLSEGCLNLPFDAIGLEYLGLAVVEPDDLFLVGRNGADIALNFVVDLLVVDLDTVEGLVEEIAQQRGCLAYFADDFIARVGIYKAFHAVLPGFNQVPEVTIQFSYFFIFRDGADNYPEVVGFDGLHQPKKSL